MYVFTYFTAANTKLFKKLACPLRELTAVSPDPVRTGGQEKDLIGVGQMWVPLPI